jgi:uncharacterized protein with FMN-binding domain
MMGLLINVVFAWISVGLAFCLSIIWLLRIVNKRSYNNENKLLGKINKGLRKHHITIGILLVITSLVHGFFSSKNIFTLNLGTLTTAAAILLGLTFMFRRKMAKLKGWIVWHRGLTVCFILLLALHLVEVGGFVGFEAVKLSVMRSLNGESSAVSILKGNVDTSQNQYKDGTYTGVGTGYGPQLTVEVTIKSNKITDIKIVSHNEKQSRFYQPAFNEIPAKIIEEQDPVVDVTTGATYSSYGIMEAVNDALSQALVSGNLPQIEKQYSNRSGGGHGNERFPGGFQGGTPNGSEGGVPQRRPDNKMQ